MEKQLMLLIYIFFIHFDSDNNNNSDVIYLQYFMTNVHSFEYSVYPGTAPLCLITSTS